MKTETVFICKDIESFRRFKLPPGWSFAAYQPGDWREWEKMRRGQIEGAGEIVQPDYFDSDIRKNPFCDVSDVFFLSYNGEAAASSSLQYLPSHREAGIRIANTIAAAEPPPHALAVLLKAMMKTADEKGYSSVWAKGEDDSLIPVLLECGFKEEEITVEEYRRDHTDYPARVKPLFRWHDNRPAGESTGNTTAYRGDEHLYKPSLLGAARIDPEKAAAGADKAFELYYTAGQVPVEEGGSVIFWMPGQGSLGTAPQIREENFPGYIELSGPEDIELEPVCDNVRVLSLAKGENPDGGLGSGDLVVGPVSIGFRIIRGRLKNGEEIKISVGRKGGFVWKKLCGRKEFTVIIRNGNGEPDRRLPAPVRIELLPKEPRCLEVLLPGSAVCGEEIEAQVSVRDEYDNRVGVDGVVSLRPVSAAGSTIKETKAYLSQGRGRAVFSRMPEVPLQVSARCSFLEGEFQSNVCVPVESDGLRVFFGDMHTHDFLSTAESYPADCYLWARDEKQLDFQSLPVQVHRWIDNEKWTVAKHFNEYFLEEGRFVSFLAFEWQHSDYGDKVIHYLGGDMPYLPVDDERYANPAGLYEALKKCDSFIISHHPGYEMDLHVPGTRWESVDNEVDLLAELWSMHGSSEGFEPTDRPLIPPYRPGGVYAGLREGVRMGFVAGSDTHTGRPGGSADDVRPYYGGLCAVWAEELTRQSLFEAFRARRTYALTGSRIVLRFTVNGCPMGSQTAAAVRYRLEAEVNAPSPIKEVQFLKRTRLMHVEQGEECFLKTEYIDSDTDGTALFYHCRVILTDGNLAVSSPVWIG